MPADTRWKEIARLIVGAFDVDIQHWMGNSFVKLRDTSVGASFADWAEANPIVFEGLLRVTSAAVRQLPDDDSILIETLYTQLGRLPVEVERAVKGGTPPLVTSNLKDDAYRKRYEDAIADLSDDDLNKLVRLKNHHVREWVNSPARIRGHLLEKWAAEDAKRQDLGDQRRAALNESLDRAVSKTKQWAEERKARYNRSK